MVLAFTISTVRFVSRFCPHNQSHLITQLKCMSRINSPSFLINFHQPCRSLSILSSYHKPPDDLNRTRIGFQNIDLRRLNHFKYKVSYLSTCPDDKQLKEKTPTPENKLSLVQRFKQMYKDYWYVLVPVHVATSTVWIGGFYYLAVSGVDVVHVLQVIGAPESWIEPLRSKAGNLVSAYTMYKLATPARYTITLGGTTFSIKYLKEWGWIKPVPSAEKLKEMYQDKKEAFQDKVQLQRNKLKQSVQETKEEFIRTKDEIQQEYHEAKEGFQRSVTETKHDFKQGVAESAREWKHVGGLVKKATSNMISQKIKQVTKREK